MVVYNVYEPPYGSLEERAERVAFVRDGFHWLAAIFPVVWLLLKGLWLELVVFVGAAMALTWGLEALGIASAVSGIMLLVIQVVLGYEASALEGAALERRGWQPAGTVVGRDLSECERRFFEGWLAAQVDAPTGSQPVPATSWQENLRKRALDAVAGARRLAGARP